MNTVQFTLLDHISLKTLILDVLVIAMKVLHRD
jgi:hypothetical protein